MFIRCGFGRQSFGGRAHRRAIPFISTCGTTTLSTPDSRFSDLPRLPRDEGGPVFAEPWQAQAFRLAAKLSEQGHFTWKQWAAELAVELRAAEEGGQADDGTRYYEHRLATLERVIARKGLTDREALSARKDAWADAYRHTPHGKPVELRNTPPDQAQ